MAKFYKTDNALDPSQSDEYDVVMLASRSGDVIEASNPLPIILPDNTSTSKDRLRTASYSTGFFNTFQHGKASDVWDETTASGATSTWDSTHSSVLLSVTSTAGSKVVRQTRNVMRYVPGRPAEYSQAFNMNGAATGIRQRVGMFDDNNGFYFEKSASGVLYFVIRSNVAGSPLETRIAQSSWNFDKFDGTGPSGLTVNDFSKCLLFGIGG